MNDKLEALFEVFETEDITPETALDTLQWDSMAMLSIIAIAKTYGKSVSGASLRGMKTVADILAAI